MNDHADTPLLALDNLTVDFSRGRRMGSVRAVDDVSFTVGPCETVGLVGESGSGKTTIGRAVLGLAPVSQGTITFDGEDITRASYRRRRELSADLQAVFQDPYSSLNPTRTVEKTLAEALRNHCKPGSPAVTDQVHAILERVGLTSEAARRYPAHFSGGQRQRIAIARALISRPRLVICDEPTSALDLSVQAEVLNLIRELQTKFHFSYLFISHDLAVVRRLSHRIIVLYKGRVMEEGDAATISGNPIHPYTKALLDAVPIPDPEEQRRRRAARARSAEKRSSVSEDGCPFAPRCPHVIHACTSERPPLETTPSGSLVACRRWRELSPEGGAGDATAQGAGIRGGR